MSELPKSTEEKNEDVDQEEEEYIVDLGSVYISKSEYENLTSWYDFLLEQAKNGNIEVDQVLTDDGMYPEDEELE